MKIGRRHVLRGAGGVAFALPFLEGLAPRNANAGGDTVPPFAIFFRQSCGVAAQQSTKVGEEPERFWPRNPGVLDAANVEGRALDELTDYASRLLVVGNVRMNYYDYGDGHANGAMQGLTARGPVVPNVAGDSEADGESLDHRIGAELNEGGRDSLFMYAGQSGWLGGACISYRGSANRRAPLHNPVTAYQTMMGIDSGQFEVIAARQKSINDLVRGEMDSLIANPALSGADRQRLELHRQSIRDLENVLNCNLADDEVAALEGGSAGYESDDGDAVLAAARAHMDVAALAVACGYTRSVSIQVGSGNDGSTRYRNLETNQLMENYHFISHRRQSHDSSGAIIPDSDLLHHWVDRNFAQTFRYLLDRLDSYIMPDGQPLLDSGMAVWHNDNGNGPGHSADNVPWVIAGGAGGFLRQGEYIRITDTGQPNHRQLLNTIGSAAGLRKDNGDLIDDHGDPALPGSPLSELMM